MQDSRLKFASVGKVSANKIPLFHFHLVHTCATANIGGYTTGSPVASLLRKSKTQGSIKRVHSFHLMRRRQFGELIKLAVKACRSFILWATCYEITIAKDNEAQVNGS